MAGFKSVDLIAQITLINGQINRPDVSMVDIQNGISNMRSIVNHASLIYCKVNTILNENLYKLRQKLEEITAHKDEDEYSSKWADFMHRKYAICDKKDDVEFQSCASKIKLTQNLSIDADSLITFENNYITLNMGGICIRSTMKELEDIIFEYSPDILRKKNKNKRHLGNLKTLENDLSKLERHKVLFRDECNKINVSIIYNVILYLLLNNRY